MTSDSIIVRHPTLGMLEAQRERKNTLRGCFGSLLLGRFGPRVEPSPCSAFGGLAFDVRPDKTAYDMYPACSRRDRVDVCPFIKSAKNNVEFTKKGGALVGRTKKSAVPLPPGGGVLLSWSHFFNVKFLYG